MKRLHFAMALTLAAGVPAQAAEPAPNGLTLPEGYKDWRLLSTHLRSDNQTIRAVLGNDIAIQAARQGAIAPWPEGTVLAKMVWKVRKHEKWDMAQVPGEFVHAEFMTKDSARFASTGGWGYARWLGQGQQPYGKDANFAQECVACHTPVKANDWVFTHPAQLP